MIEYNLSSINKITNITTSIGEPKKVLFFKFSEIWFPLILFYISSYFFHEFGHFLMAERFGLKPSFKGWGVETELDGTKEQQIKVAKAGILFGFIPIMLSFWSVSSWFLVLIPLYLYGCRTDFKMIKRIKGEINVLEKKN